MGLEIVTKRFIKKAMTKNCIRKLTSFSSEDFMVEEKLRVSSAYLIHTLEKYFEFSFIVISELLQNNYNFFFNRYIQYMTKTLKLTESFDYLSIRLLHVGILRDAMTHLLKKNCKQLF